LDGLFIFEGKSTFFGKDEGLESIVDNAWDFLAHKKPYKWYFTKLDSW